MMTKAEEHSNTDLPRGMDPNSLITFDPMKTVKADSKGAVDTNILTVLSNRVQSAAKTDIDKEHKTDRKNYPLEKKIGEGGFGEVWEAQQTSLGRMVAVKKLKQQLSKEANDSKHLSDYLTISFEMEALSTAVLEHPNIIPIYDLSTDEDDRPMLAMKLVRGKPWDEVLKEDFDFMDYRDYIRKHVHILIDVCQATAFAHSRGIIHRDIKPSQVMIGEFGEVLLMDWGLAIVYDSEVTQSTLGHHKKLPTNTIDSAPNPAGTVAFMAPEQTEETAKNLGPWTDVYLLGGTLYFILTLKPPHEGSASYALVQAKSGEYTKLTEHPVANNIPTELKQLAEKCLITNIEERKVLTAVDLADQLEDYLTGAGAQDKAEELVERLDEELESSEENIVNYDSLLQCQSLLRQAREHWKHHPRYDNIEDTINRKFAQEGIKTGDLMLAKMHAAQIFDDEIQKNVLTKIDAKEKELKAIRRQRKLLLWSFILLISIIAIGALYFDARLAVQKDKLNEALEQQSHLNHQMNERLKDLACLYGVADSIQHHDDFALVFQDVCTLIPQAWQYPEITTVRLVYNGRVYTSDNFQSGDWSQTARIKVTGESHGLIKVFYTEERPEMDEGPFLSHERNLIDGIAKLLGEAITKAEMKEHTVSLKYDIGEREKELACIYGLTHSIATRNTTEEIAGDLLALIPPAWQYPETTQGKIIIGDQTWESPGYTETPWQQAAFIKDGDENIGKIIVSYREEKPPSHEGPFLKEERTLINALAAAMESHLSKK